LTGVIQKTHGAVLEPVEIDVLTEEVLHTGSKCQWALGKQRTISTYFDHRLSTTDQLSTPSFFDFNNIATDLTFVDFPYAAHFNHG
jgi:hypothetical protein